MAKTREEIVGKRFLSVSSGSKLKLSKINEWDWRAGVIRACTHADSKHHDLQVLVEYDDVEWQRREWVHVYRGQLFQIFLLERTLAWASRKHPTKIRSPPILWPALVYMPLVDQAGISEHKYRPVEYLVDRALDYHDYSQVQPYQDGDVTGVCGEDCVRALRAWVGEQDGQRILLTTPSVLVGFRVQVYRSEGTTQWYTAVIVGYNDATRELTVTDDTVLEEHSEDPSLVQIRLIGEGVVESILRGENVGITPRRSRTATNNHHQSGVRHIRRDGVVPARGRKNSLTRPNNLPPTASHTLPPNTAHHHSHPPVITHSLASTATDHTLSNSTSSSSSSPSSSPSPSSSSLEEESSSSKVQEKPRHPHTKQEKQPTEIHSPPSKGIYAKLLKRNSRSTEEEDEDEEGDTEIKEEPIVPCKVASPPSSPSSSSSSSSHVRTSKEYHHQPHSLTSSQQQQQESKNFKKDPLPYQSKEISSLQIIKDSPTQQVKGKPPEAETIHKPCPSSKKPKDQQQQLSTLSIDTQKEVPKKKQEEVTAPTVVKDHLQQPVKEQPLRQIKEKPPEKDPEKKANNDLKNKDKKVSTGSKRLLDRENHLRKIREHTHNQVQVLLTRHSKHHLRESLKTPPPAPKSKKIFQSRDSTEDEIEIVKEENNRQEKHLITRQTKEILTRQAKEQLSRQTKVLLTRSFKDKLSQDCKKELIKQESDNQSVTSGENTPKERLSPKAIESHKPSHDTNSNTDSNRNNKRDQESTLVKKEEEEVAAATVKESKKPQKDLVTEKVNNSSRISLQRKREYQQPKKEGQQPNNNNNTDNGNCDKDPASKDLKKVNESLEPSISLKAESKLTESSEVVEEEEEQAKKKVSPVSSPKVKEEKNCPLSRSSSLDNNSLPQLKQLGEEKPLKRTPSTSSSSSSIPSSPLPSQPTEEKTQRSKRETSSHRATKEDQPRRQKDGDNSTGKCVLPGVRWKKRNQGSITSETSSGEEEHHRPVRERRSLHHTPDAVSRILTRLEKQNSIEDTTTSGSPSSSGNSTPDHRPVRRPHRNSKVQNLISPGHIEAKISGSGTDTSICNNSKSDTNFSGCSSSGSNTSAGSTSTSSSSTPEPELPSRPPSRRVAAAAALRHQKLISHRLRGSKRGKSRGTQRTRQRWRSVSPVTSASGSPSDLSHPRPTTNHSAKNKNNDENVNSTNCEVINSKSQKRKYNSPCRISSKNHNSNPSRDILRSKKDPLVEKIPQHCPNKETVKESGTRVSDSESAEDPIVVVYEKTNFKNRTPNNKRNSIDTRSPSTRSSSLNLGKTVSTNSSLPPESLNRSEISGVKIKNEEEIASITGSDNKQTSILDEESCSRASDPTSPLKDANKSSIKNSILNDPESPTSIALKSPVACESESEEVLSKPIINVSSPSDQDSLSQPSLDVSSPCKVKSPSRTLISEPLISSDEGPDEELKRRLETSVDLIVASLKDESESENCGEDKEENCSEEKDSEKAPTLDSAKLETSAQGPAVVDTLCTCACTSSTVSDSLITTTAIVSKASVSQDNEQQATSVIRTTDDSLSVISSNHNEDDKISVTSSSAIAGQNISSGVVSSTAAICGSVDTVSIVTTVTSVTSVNSVSVVTGTTSAIVSSASNAKENIQPSDSSKVNISSNSSSVTGGYVSGSNSDSHNSNRGCAEVAGVVSGRAVTITATSGPGPSCNTRVASPPSVSITAVVRSPAHLQPANPEPAQSAPHHHDGAPHSSSLQHHQLQPANPHHYQHHHHHQAQQHHQSQQQQQLTTASATSRMDHCDGSSDSGVSVTERSVSRSSVLSDDRSSSAEVKPNTPTPITASQLKTAQAAALLLDRKEAIRVYRDPSLLSQSEHTVRHIHSVQHTSMSQHYPGVPAPHHPAPSGPPGSGGSHPSSHHGSHGQPPVTLPHALPPNLPYQGHPAPASAAVPSPMHLSHLPHPLPPGLYQSLSQDVWKLGPVPPMPHHAYAGLLSHHQEELLQIERQREIDRAERERILRERREADAREKERERQAKEKMERERSERERREREESQRREKERRAREEKERQQYQVDQHFKESFRLAQQKHVGENVRHLPADHLNQAYYVHGLPNHHPSNHPSHNHSLLMTQHSKAYQAQAHAQKVAGWNPLGGLDERRILEQRQEDLRRAQAHEPEKMVRESIFKAFRESDRSREPPVKMRYPPPSAHMSSKPPGDKASVSAGLPKIAEPSFNLNYPSNYIQKEAKMSHPSERVPYTQYSEPRDKASVIIQPDIKYDKGPPPHSVSPKQRPPERSSPYPPSSAYKSPHDPSSSMHRSSSSHHPAAPLPHSIEHTKARQPQSSPHSTTPSPVHPDYYPPGAKPPPTTFPSNLVNAGLVPNPMHMSSVSAKTKVSSPPPQMYGKPGITTGTPVCRVDSRPTQPIPLTSKPTVGGPPPAHSGRGSHGEPRPMPPHEQRPPMDRGPYDARIYPPTVPSPHHKHVVAPGPPPQSRMPPVSSPHVPTPHIPHPSPHPSPQPTQTQPLDLGTREDTASPSKRRTQTPTPQDPKKPRYETSNSQPLLARVSEPSPLYPTAATTITTVENTVALAANLSRVSSPVSRPPSHPPAATTPTLQRSENSSSPGVNKMTEPEKSNSPGPASGYVHKLKKAWLQRHESGVEIIPIPSGKSSPGLSNRVATPPPANSSPANSKPATTTITTTTTTPAVTIKSSSEHKAAVRKPRYGPMGLVIPNGHREDVKEGDTSSTDSEGSSGQKAKRISKNKRKINKLKNSDTNSDSDDKDSDMSDPAAKNSGRLVSKADSEPKKRGRKPKTKLEKEKEEGPKPKKSKEEPPQNDPLLKPPVSQLKKTGESFLQDGSCYEVAPKLPKCRECRWTAHQRNKKNTNIFCRFYAFRRLRYTKNGQLAVAGFSDPIKDVSIDDLKLWVPDSDSPPDDLDVETSKFLLTHVGDQFCDLVEQEKEAMALHMGDNNVVAWKRVVQGVREMCDVCETTLFNIHWACSKCGFVVCIDCYKGRKNGTVKVWDEGGTKDRDEFSWLLCASRLPHEQDKLMLTQIISGNALIDLGKKVHEVRHEWNIPQYCDCPEAKKYKDQAPQDDKKKVNGVNKDLLKNIKKESKDQLVNGTLKQEKNSNDKSSCKDEEMSNSPLNFFADVALSNDKRDSESSDSDSDSDSDDKEGSCSTLRKLLIRPNAKPNGTKDETGGSTKPSKENSKKKPKLETVDDVISCVIEQNPDKDDVKDNNQVVLKHFIRKYNYGPRGRDPLPIRIMTKTESSLLYPGVAHSWLCDGKLLRLLDPLATNNTSLFQDQWKRGQPVIISGVGQKLSSDLWRPNAFSKDYGDIKNDLINCLTGNIVPNQPMKKFWDGFDNYGKRLKDDKGQPMVLKLKDWPPGDDFAEMLPSRFEDLMSVLPMGEYTRRNGRLNLAGRLPDCFVRPDLGPKMYIAYGSAIHASRASTNLHLDISDAANVMCYVGIPKDADYEEHIKEALKAIDEAGCDILTRRRVREKEEIPGALWHIYHARDADKIRDLLNKVAIERGDKLEPHHDPIHDQSWYLDGHLRERLYKEYGVEGYAIVQCYGDAVFIPAGAPHQVRNLHNCVKVAEDFVSPENIAYCFHLTQEFRHLSDTHTNHEDKLQIKNIIYHDMKDSLACLMSAGKDVKVKTEVKEEVDKIVKKEFDS